MNDNEIGTEAAVLVALDYANDDTAEFKLALAQAAQRVINHRDEMAAGIASDLRRGNGRTTKDIQLAGKTQSERCAAALQNIVDANSNLNAALHAARLVNQRKRK